MSGKLHLEKRKKNQLKELGIRDSLEKKEENGNE